MKVTREQVEGAFERGDSNRLIQLYVMVNGDESWYDAERVIEEIVRYGWNEESLRDILHLFWSEEELDKDKKEVKEEDKEKKELFTALSEYYDQYKSIGCKTPEEAVRLGLDAHYGKIKEPKEPPKKIRDAYSTNFWKDGPKGERSVWTVGGMEWVLGGDEGDYENY